MSENEKLIEEAREVVRSWDLKGSWNADSPIGMLARMADALESAEKAHAPTDDEREALIKRLEDEVEYRVRTAVALSKGGHDHEEQVRQGRASVRFLAAGFRRTEVPEPSTERELTPCGNLVCTGCRVCGCPALGIAPEPSAEHAYQGNRSQDTCWVMVDGEMCRKPIEAHVRTQGEPSEAWQREHGRHWWACAVNAPRAEWVGPCDCDLSRDPSLAEHPAALRAAGEVGQ